jgi:hypothetical protein
VLDLHAQLAGEQASVFFVHPCCQRSLPVLLLWAALVRVVSRPCCCAVCCSSGRRVEQGGMDQCRMNQGRTEQGRWEQGGG